MVRNVGRQYENNCRDGATRLQRARLDNKIIFQERLDKRAEVRITGSSEGPVHRQHDDMAWKPYRSNERGAGNQRRMEKAPSTHSPGRLRFRT